MVISSSAISVASPSAMAGYSHSGCGATVLSLTQAAASRIGEDGGHPAEVGGGEPVCGVEGESVLEIVGDGAAADVVSDVMWTTFLAPSFVTILSAPAETAH